MSSGTIRRTAADQNARDQSDFCLTASAQVFDQQWQLCLLRLFNRSERLPNTLLPEILPEI